MHAEHPRTTGVLRTRTAHHADREDDDRAHRHIEPVHVAPLAEFLENLVTGDQREIAKPHVDDRLHPGNGGTRGKTRLEGLGDIAVDHPFVAELIGEPFLGAEPATGRDPLPEHEDPFVAVHLLDQREAHGRVVGHRHGALLSHGRGPGK